MEQLKFESEDEFRAFQAEILMRIEAKTMMLSELVVASVEQITSQKVEEKQLHEFLVSNFERHLAGTRQRYGGILKAWRAATR